MGECPLPVGLGFVFKKMLWEGGGTFRSDGLVERFLVIGYHPWRGTRPNSFLFGLLGDEVSNTVHSPV